eukprot:3074837-Pleurochrysis_carterae.AAC.3
MGGLSGVSEYSRSDNSQSNYLVGNTESLSSLGTSASPTGCPHHSIGSAIGHRRRLTSPRKISTENERHSQSSIQSRLREVLRHGADNFLQHLLAQQNQVA